MTHTKGPILLGTALAVCSNCLCCVSYKFHKLLFCQHSAFRASGERPVLFGTGPPPWYGGLLELPVESFAAIQWRGFCGKEEDRTGWWEGGQRGGLLAGWWQSGSRLLICPEADIALLNPAPTK